MVRRNEAEGSEELVRALSEALLAGEGAAIPTSTFGRLGRTARVALRMSGMVLARRPGQGEALPRALEPEAMERLVRALGELKGVGMKMGQIFSYIDDSLPPEARGLLALLQTTSQPTSFDEIERVVREDLGERAGALLDGMDRAPVASASIGQVHRGRLPSGEDVAVKVLHPGIDEAIRADFRAALPGSALGSLFMPGSNVGEVIEEARDRFLEECDYALEARRQARFARLLEGHPDLVVPAVHEAWCGPRVLVTAWHDGLGLEAFLAGDPPLEERNRLGRALYEFYLGSLYRHGLFNADPHPGNLLFEPDGARRVVVLDHGCVREFDADTVRAIAGLSAAVRSGDAESVRHALVRLGARDPGTGAALRTTHGLLKAFFAPVLEPGVHRITAGISSDAAEVYRTKLAAARLRIPGKLLFLFRIRFGLYAVLSRLGAELDWRELESHLAGEGARVQP